MTVTTNKGYPLPVINGNYNVWGILLNQGFSTVDQNMGGNVSVSVAGNTNVALTSAQLENVFVTLTGALTGNIQVSLPASAGGFWFIWNNTSGAFTLTMTSAGAGSSFLMNQGSLYMVVTDGTNTYGITNIGPIANDTLLGNISGSSSSPIAITMTNALDNMIGNAVGAVLVRGSSGWVALPVGTNGQVLQTQGGGSPPIWTSLAAIPATGVLADLANTTFVAGDMLYYNGTNMVPLAPGTTGQVVTMSGGAPSWAYISVVRNSQSGNYMLAAVDRGAVVSFSATATLTTYAGAPANFWCYVQNNSTGNVTWSGTVDGISNWIMYPNEARLVQFDGINWHSVVLEGGSITFTASGTFLMPPGYEGAEIDGIGAGGGGAGASGANNGAGGGGGHRQTFKSAISGGASCAVTIGAGGAGGIGASNGNNGGATTFAVPAGPTFTWLAGQGGTFNGTGGDGGGYGFAVNAGPGVGQQSGYGGGVGGSSQRATAADQGGGGGGYNSTTAAPNGGDSLSGGPGGGSGGNSTNTSGGAGGAPQNYSSGSGPAASSTGSNGTNGSVASGMVGSGASGANYQASGPAVNGKNGGNPAAGASGAAGGTSGTATGGTGGRGEVYIRLI